MIRETAVSSHLRPVGYDEQTLILEIESHDGGVIILPPEAVHTE
jgi:hypothetical protein